MVLSILQALLAGIKSNLLLVVLLRFFVAALVREERLYVVLIEQCFTLVPSSAPGSMDELLV